MCIAFFALDPSPGVRFVLCFGRDEYLARPTQAAHWWPDQPHILAGRDEQYGGTWLAASTNGRIAFLTNLREKEADPDQVALEGCQYCTRGELPTRFINSGNSPEAYCQSLEGWRYHGFNLVCVDLVAASMAYANNQDSGRSQGLPAAVHSPPPASATPSSTSTPPHPSQPSPLAAPTPGLPRPSLNTSVAQQGSRLAGGLTAQSHMLAAAEPAWPSSSHTEGGPNSLLPCAKHQRPSTSGVSSSTRGMQSAAGTQQLQPGVVYGLSNGLLNAWPKVQSGRAAAQRLLQQQPMARAAAPGPAASCCGGGGERGDESSLPWGLLLDEVLGDVGKLGVNPPCDAQGHPLLPEAITLEDHLDWVASSRFIKPVASKHGLYGTRSQTILVVWGSGKAELRERHLDPTDMQWRVERHPFNMRL